MQLAFEQGRRAADQGEVPVGAVVVSPSGELLGEGCNNLINAHDPSGHAEINALRAAALHVRNYRLPGCSVYVTIEPCLMCVGALVHARIGTVVFGAREPKAGAVVSHPVSQHHRGLNHSFAVVEGVMREECAELMVRFFAERRLST